MNVFSNILVARDYDDYYQTNIGKATDKIEKIILSDHLVHVPCGHILELGCGTGHWTDFLYGQGYQVTAIDESGAMLSIAQNKKIKNATFAKANATTLPFASNSFSTIVSVTMLEFVEDAGRVLDEINRVLKPDGHLIFGCLNALSELGKNKQYDEVFQHARFFTPDEIRQLLLRFGKPKLSYGVYYSPLFELLDGTEKQNTVQPAFIVASVQKININGNNS